MIQAGNGKTRVASQCLSARVDIAPAICLYLVELSRFKVNCKLIAQYGWRVPFVCDYCSETPRYGLSRCLTNLVVATKLIPAWLGKFHVSPSFAQSRLVNTSIVPVVTNMRC